MASAGSQRSFLIRILLLPCLNYIPRFRHLQFMIQPDPAPQLNLRSFNQRSQLGAFRIRRTIIHASPTCFITCSEPSLAECHADFGGDAVSAGLCVQEAILTTSPCKMRYPSGIIKTANVRER